MWEQATKIWLELKLTANCDVIQTVPWILFLACAAEPFLNEVLAVILKAFVLKPVINVCSFILTVITKEMWLLSKLVPDCFSFIPCVVLGISFLTTFSNWRLVWGWAVWFGSPQNETKAVMELSQKMTTFVFIIFFSLTYLNLRAQRRPALDVVGMLPLMPLATSSVSTSSSGLAN